MTINLLGKHIEFRTLAFLVMTASLVIVSFTILLIGLTLSSRENADDYMPEHLIQSLKESTESLGVDVDLSNGSLQQFLQPLANALILVGLAATAVSVLGFVGAWLSIRLALLIYLVASSAMLFIHIIFIILIYGGASTLAVVIKPYISDLLVDYAGIEGTNTNSVAWNAMMSYKKCCGMTDYTDFGASEKWPAPINGTQYNLTTPVICCKIKTTNYSCAENPNDDNNYWKTGCQGKVIKPFIGDNLSPLVMILIYFMGQGGLIYCAAWILFLQPPEERHSADSWIDCDGTCEQQP